MSRVARQEVTARHIAFMPLPLLGLRNIPPRKLETREGLPEAGLVNPRGQLTRVLDEGSGKVPRDSSESAVLENGALGV